MKDDLKPGQMFRHIKRGTEYEIIGVGELQMSHDSLVDGSSMVLYRGANGQLWCREEGEFLDGRFERVNRPEPVADEPVAWMYHKPGGSPYIRDIPPEEAKWQFGVTPLYTHPPAPDQAQPIDDEALVDWQPIETAPHGRPVLLAWQDWRDGKWIMDVGPASTGERNEVASSTSHHGSATQWMPLPAAPALSEHAGEGGD